MTDGGGATRPTPCRSTAITTRRAPFPPVSGAGLRGQRDRRRPRPLEMGSETAAFHRRGTVHRPRSAPSPISAAMRSLSARPTGPPCRRSGRSHADGRLSLVRLRRLAFLADAGHRPGPVQRQRPARRSSAVNGTGPSTPARSFRARSASSTTRIPTSRSRSPGALNFNGKKVSGDSREYRVPPGGNEKFDLALEMPCGRVRTEGEFVLSLVRQGARRSFRDVEEPSRSCGPSEFRRAEDEGPTRLRPAGGDRGGSSNSTRSRSRS